MKAYILTEKDFDLLNAALAEDPSRGLLSVDVEKRAIHNDNYRHFNFIVRRWIDEVKR